MSNQSEKVKRWRKRTKTRIIDSMGGKCCICGYSGCHSALALHHKDPSKKEFGFGGVRGNPKSWAKIVVELRKCVLLCNNCHAEVHDGLVFIPNDAASFDENYTDYNA